MPESHTPAYSIGRDSGIFRHTPFVEWRKNRNDKSSLWMNNYKSFYSVF